MGVPGRQRMTSFILLEDSLFNRRSIRELGRSCFMGNFYHRDPSSLCRLQGYLNDPSVAALSFDGDKVFSYCSKESSSRFCSCSCQGIKMGFPFDNGICFVVLEVEIEAGNTALEL